MKMFQLSMFIRSASGGRNLSVFMMPQQCICYNLHRQLRLSKDKTFAKTDDFLDKIIILFCSVSIYQYRQTRSEKFSYLSHTKIIGMDKIVKTLRNIAVQHFSAVDKMNSCIA